MMEQEAVRDHQASVLAKVRASTDVTNWSWRPEPGSTALAIVVHPGVLPPGGTDTALLASELASRNLAGKRVLEVGCGTGVLSVLAGRRGATGVAVDVNRRAVANAAANFNSSQVPFAARYSDVFDEVEEERFDLIMANPPYVDGDASDDLDRAFFGTTHVVDRLFAGVGAHLRPGGELLITFAEWGEWAHYRDCGEESGLAVRRLRSGVSSDGQRWYHLEAWAAG